MTDERPRSPAVLGAAAALLVVGVLLAVFGSIAYGVVLVLAAVCLPLFFRGDPK